MRCLYCGKELPKAETEKIERAGVDPFCSLYCFNVYGGVPLPYSQADGIITEIINKPKGESI